MLQQIGEERGYSGQPNALVRVRLVRTALELQSLRPEWQRLHSKAAVASGGDLAAMLYAYRLREHIFLVQAGFNPQYARWSPGSVLLEYALEHAITEGNHALDFLRGEHRYKERLATHWRETVSVTVCRPTIAAAAFRARKVYVARTNAKVRNFAKSVSLP